SGAIDQIITPAGEGWAGVDVAPSHRKLAARESDRVVGHEMRLRTALAGVTDRYDVVLIDCPPSLGSLTTNALVAADQVLVVTWARSQSVRAVEEFLRTVAVVRTQLNPGLSVAGIAVNFVKGRRDTNMWVE